MLCFSATATLNSYPIESIFLRPVSEAASVCVQALLAVRRQGAAAEHQQRERSHLLMLYGVLCDCIASREHRIKELVQDALQLAGSELRLCDRPAASRSPTAAVASSRAGPLLL